jgi:hypothetical protein
MSVRSARTLSQFFQSTMGITPVKRFSDTFEGVAPVVFEQDLVFEPDFSAKEQERIWDYHTNLAFKDGEFLVRAIHASLFEQRSPTTQDMGLSDPKRRLLCAGKLFRQSNSAFGRKANVEILVLLFDNYR